MPSTSGITDRDLLIWIHQRLVNVHDESKHMDYMHSLREVINGMPKDKRSIGGTVTMISTDILNEIENL